MPASIHSDSGGIGRCAQPVVVVVASVVDVLDALAAVESGGAAMSPRKTASDDESRFGTAPALTASGRVDGSDSDLIASSAGDIGGAAAVSRFTRESLTGRPEEKVITTRAIPEITATIPDRRFQVRHDRIEDPPAGFNRASQSPVVKATSSGSAGTW